MPRADAPTRVITWSVAGLACGFVVFAALFYSVAPHGGPERLLWAVFAVMAAIPVSALAALFASLFILREELDDLRSEIIRLQQITESLRLPATPSTQFKSGRPERTPE